MPWGILGLLFLIALFLVQDAPVGEEIKAGEKQPPRTGG